MLTKLAAISLLCASTYAATIPEGGKDMLPADWQGAAKPMGSSKLWKTEAADLAGHGKGWRVTVADDTAGPFQLQLSAPVEGQVKAGDRILVAFDARCLPGSSTDGKGRVQVFVEIKEPPNYEKLGQDAADITSEWQTIFVPFPARIDSKSGVTFASLLPGGKKQTLEIANMRLLNFGADFDITKLPRPYIAYPGREADAPWRKLALERIAKYRTTDIAIEVVNEDGTPVPDAKISIALKRHTFAFGAAVKAKLLMGEGPDSIKYRDMIDENFSAIVLENDLKPFAWNEGTSTQSKSYQPEWTLNALAWAKSRGLKSRGHYLCWGPWEPWSEKLKDDPQAIRDRVMKHLDSVMKGAGGLVDEWDAVNHPAGWEDPRNTVDKVLGPEFYADIFKAARARSGLPLWINEDQVFRPGRQQDEFYECIKDLIARGAAPDGIGNQAHFHSSFLPGPEEMLRISDRFAALVPNLELTEFDVITNGDEQLQADWLRDVLTMAYSHPAYSGMILWVFWEGAGWKPETALWRNDWSEKPNAKVWRDLVCGQWRTQATGKTDPHGTFSARGHRGLYEVSVEVGGKTRVHSFNTEHGSGLLRIVTQP